jgi:DNA-directed RNA polymerase subunit RPC12/RpoP
MFLACPNRCSGNRFELWNASVFVDGRGRYLDHRAEDSPLYRCAQCGSPAIDLSAVPGAMAADREIEASEASEHQYACPACEALFRVPRGQSPVVCPACGQTFPVESAS